MRRRWFWWMLHKDLKSHSYKILITLELETADYARWEGYAVVAQLICENDDIVIVMRDKCIFRLNGTVNKQQSCCYWSAENPRHIHKKLLHRYRVILWRGVAPFEVIDPYFLRKRRWLAMQTLLITLKRNVC